MREGVSQLTLLCLSCQIRKPQLIILFLGYCHDPHFIKKRSVLKGVNDTYPLIDSNKNIISVYRDKQHTKKDCTA